MVDNKYIDDIMRCDMIELLSLTLFAGIVGVFLIGIPVVVEKLSSEEFCARYFSHLSERTLHSFGK